MTATVEPRIAVLCDYLEEEWPSMDLVADMLVAGMRDRYGAPDRVAAIRPAMRVRFGSFPLAAGRRHVRNADRLANRFFDYPNLARTLVSGFELFHVADHSYAHLVHVLPARRTGVFCHDLDAFRCLLEPDRERRPRWFRAMSRRILTGLQSASVVFYSTGAVRDQIERFGIVDPARLVHAPYGIAPEFRPAAEGDAVAPEPPFLLHVGSCIPRKRIDVLLDTFAEVRKTIPALRLIHAGGEWTDEQTRQIERLGIADAVEALSTGQSRETIADLYRRASVVLLPSEAEGFGLPVVEALACGAVVVASDIPVLREVGGDAAVYCPVGDVAAWSTAVARLVQQPDLAPDRATRLARAGVYSWSTHAKTVLDAYSELLTP